jgi:Zn-dependent metalloprotease
MRPEVALTPPEVLARYRVELGLGVHDEMRLERSPQRTGSGRHEVSFYQQVHRNVPVAGHGLFFLEQDGIAFGANGRIIAGLDQKTTPAITEQQAVAAATRGFAIGQPYPWDADPTSGRPTVVLQLVSTWEHRTPADFHLAWVVNFVGVRTPLAEFSYVDAITGKVLYQQDRIRY